MSEKRLEIEKIASDVVQESGLNNLSFRTVAERAGIKSSSVHYYFPEKSDLADTLIINYTDKCVAALVEIDRSKRSLKGKLRGVIEIFEDVVKSEKFCLCGMMAAEVAELKDDSRDLLIDYFDRIEQWLSKVLQENHEHIAINIKPRRLAMIIVSGLEGAILIDRVDGRLERLRAQQELILGFVR